MPWNENGDGPKGSGPWGSGSNGNGSGDKDNVSPWKRPGGGDNNGGNNGGGGGGGGSDLEEQMRRMQERWRNRRGGGGKGGGKSPLGPLGLAVLALFGFLAWASSGVVVVNEGERAAIFQFGKYKTNYQPGLHFHLPVPIETHEIMPSQLLQTTEIVDRDDISMLTGDENILEVKFEVRWYYDSQTPEVFILNVDDGRKLVKDASESVMREIVGKLQLEQVLTSDRGNIEIDVRTQLQSLLTDYQAGVNVVEVLLLEVTAPRGEVFAAFTDVVQAGQDAERFIEEARRTANQLVPRARGDAARLLQDAEAYKERVIAEATGEADRFEQILAEYEDAKQVTRERMYLETIEKILANSDKLLLDNEAGALPYLQIDPRTGRP